MSWVVSAKYSKSANRPTQRRKRAIAVRKSSRHVKDLPSSSPHPSVCLCRVPEMIYQWYEYESGGVACMLHGFSNLVLSLSHKRSLSCNVFIRLSAYQRFWRYFYMFSITFRCLLCLFKMGGRLGVLHAGFLWR